MSGCTATAVALVRNNVQHCHPPIHILGAGSIGLLWASSIRSAIPNYPVTLLLRDHHRKRLQKQQQQGKGNNNSNDNNNGVGGLLEINWIQRYPNLNIKSEQQQQQQQTKAEEKAVLLPYQFISIEETKTKTNKFQQTTSQQQQQQQQSSTSLSSKSKSMMINKIENLIVTTKSYQAKDAVESILDRLTPTSTIIVLCNGALSVRDDLLNLLKDKKHKVVNINNNTSSSSSSTTTTKQQQQQQQPKLVLATTTHGAYQQQHSEPNNNSQQPLLVHAGFGKTFIEDRDIKIIEDIVNIWNVYANLNCHILTSKEMELLLWNKLATNCIINPLTAIYKCTNGELLLEPTFPQIQHELIKEIVQVFERVVQQQQQEVAATTAQQQQQQCNSDVAAAARAATTTTEIATNSDDGGSGITEESIRKFVLQTIHDTSKNKSSMYQDVLSGRETEIDYLNGYIVQLGQKYNVDCPTNEDIVQRIKEISSLFKI